MMHQRLRDRVGLNLPPLFLRLMLGIIFLWAGLGKVSETIDVSGESAAVLANMGVIAPAGSVPAPKAEAPQPAPAKVPDAKPPEIKPPEIKPPDTTLPEPKSPAANPPETKPSETKPGGGAAAEPSRDGSARIMQVRQQPAAKQYTALDFPSSVRVRRLHRLTTMLHGAAAPEGGAGRMPLWPAKLASGSIPLYLAWAVALTELAGGLCLLLGLLTRLAAFGIAGVMLGAMWLTEIGPAIQSGKAVLGFLPNYPAFGGEWQTLLFQFALCMAALALAFCGPGRLSLDTALLSGRSEGDDED